MVNFERMYYEQKKLWEQDFLALTAERERISETIDLIPLDVQTILDAGCGNGAFLNSLPDVYEKVGLDISREALKHVRTRAVLGDISTLPFNLGSFDIVICLEVLEHLPTIIFQKAISEIQRVAKKYIIISVPNSEDLYYHLVVCPECQCWFNPYRHVRSFDSQKLTTLFKEFSLYKLREIGPLEPRPRYNRLLYRIYRLWRNPLPPPTAVCPQCGYQSVGDRPLAVTGVSRSSKFFVVMLSLLKPIAKKFVWSFHKKRRWLLALYVRNGK